MKTIILAGGMGKRLRDICGDKPKSLFEIKGKSLLEHSLDSLNKIGIKEVTLSLGYQSELIRERIGNVYGSIRVKYSKDLNGASGSMHGVYSVFCNENPEACLILDGDLIYDFNVMNYFINDPRENAAFLTTPCGNGDETFVTLDERGRIDYLRLKKDENPLLLEGKSVWEFNGVAKFSKGFLEKMISIHEEKLKQGRAGEYYEECALEINKKLPWYGIVYPDFVLAEIDRKEDVKRAEKLLDKLKK